MIKTIKDIDLKGKRVIDARGFQRADEGRKGPGRHADHRLPSYDPVLPRPRRQEPHAHEPPRRSRKDAKKAREKAEKDGKPWDEEKYMAGKHRMRPVAEYLAAKLGRPVVFAGEDSCYGKKAFIESQPDGTVVMLENTRFHKEETSEDPAERDKLARELATYGEVFVNDAFGTAHRDHASTASIAKFMPVSVGGFLMEKEVAYSLSPWSRTRPSPWSPSSEAPRFPPRSRSWKAFSRTPRPWS